MIDEENNFSFEADTGLDDDAATPAAHAAHMAPSSAEHADVPTVGAHMAEPVDAPLDTVPADDADRTAVHAAALDILNEDAATHAAAVDILNEDIDLAEKDAVSASVIPTASAEAPAEPCPEQAPDASDAAPDDEPAAPAHAAPKPRPLPTASLDDTAEIDAEAVEAQLKDPGSTQSFAPITEERIDTDSTYDAGTTTTLMWGARSDVGCVRSHNEDSYLVQSPLFCVCDGMGGHAAGEVASSLAVETIAKTAPNAADPALLAASVEAANAAIIEAAANGLGKSGMGCTATCAYIDGTTIAIAHVGDSRAYLLHEGTLIRVTRDHSYVEELVDAGEITADEARTHPNRSVITRALGSDPAMYADHFQLNIEEGDRLILCSDGLSSMVPDGDIETIAAQSSTAQICTDNLVDAALAAGGGDNVTVVVVDVVDDGRIKTLISKRRRNLIIALVALVAALVLSGIVAAVSITSSVFLGVNSDDTVAIYTGIHADFLGIKLYHIEDTTSVKLSDLPDDTRNRLEEGIPQDNLEDARNTISEYRAQIDAAETEQVLTAETIRKSADANAGETDSSGADGSATDTPTDTTDTTQTTKGGA